MFKIRTLIHTSLSCLAILALAGCGRTIHHTSVNASGMSEGIMVTGNGKATGQPDIARAQIGVEVRAGTAEQATQELNTRMAALIAAVKRTGIPDKDVRTTNFSIFFEPVPDYPPRPLAAPDAPVSEPAPAKAEKPRKAGDKAGLPTPPVATAAPAEPPVKLPQGHYRASNTVEVTIRQLDRVSAVLTAATSAGANQVYGLEFALDDPAALESTAREKAMADARARATRLAALAGVKLGPVISIQEHSGGMPVHGGMARAEMAAKMDSSVPIERGELTVHTNVNVLYALPKRHKHHH